MTAALAVALSVAAHNKAKIQLSGIARKKNGFSYYNLLYLYLTDRPIVKVSCIKMDIEMVILFFEICKPKK